MIPVSLTGFTGYFVFDPHLNAKIFFTTSGVLLLAISASVLNQIQEVELDNKMNRTQYRPIPAKRITLHHAALFCIFTLIAGTTVLYLAGNLTAALIGLITYSLVQWNIYLFQKNNSFCCSSRCGYRCFAPGHRMGGSWWRAMGKTNYFYCIPAFHRTNSSFLVTHNEVW